MQVKKLQSFAATKTLTVITILVEDEIGPLVT